MASARATASTHAEKLSGWNGVILIEIKLKNRNEGEGCMLNYEKFKEKLIEMVQSELGKGISVHCAAMEGNDRMMKEGVVLEGKTEPFSLCIHLDELYKNYLRTGNIQMCVRLVVKLERMNGSVNYNAMLDTWENLKSRIFIKLVNSKRNQKRLRNLSHSDFHDVSLLCYVTVCELQ